jgi:hypothetical protein
VLRARARVAAEERVDVMENEVVRRVAVSSIVWLDDSGEVQREHYFVGGLNSSIIGPSRPWMTESAVRSQS